MEFKHARQVEKWHIARATVSEGAASKHDAAPSPAGPAASRDGGTGLLQPTVSVKAFPSSRSGIKSPLLTAVAKPRGFRLSPEACFPWDRWHFSTQRAAAAGLKR